MTIKMDLEKGYDYLDWKFVENTLRAIDMEDNLLKLIMACSTTPYLNVLYKMGKRHKTFSLQGGFIKETFYLLIYLFYVWKGWVM